MSKVNILNVNVDKINTKQTIEKIDYFINDEKQHYIVTVNPEIILKTIKDEKYRGIINNADIVTPDGGGIIIGSIISNDPIWHRVTGVDMTYEIIKLADKNGYKIFLLGAKEGYAQIAKTKIELKYKNIQIVGAEEGFKNIKNISESENEEILSKINKSKAQILLVGYGAPFQEKWIYENLNKMPGVKLAIGVGGTIDFMSGKIPRAPKILRKLYLEWAWRLAIEPNRINRILNAIISFLYNLIKWKIHTLKPLREVVIGVILNNDNKILLIDRDYDKNYWQLPQGGIEKNESPKQALLREMKEEVGLEKLTILGIAKKINNYYWPIHYMDKQKKSYEKFSGQKQIIYFLRQTEKETPKLNEDFHKNFKWVEKGELLNTVNINRIECSKIILEEIDKYLQ